MEPQKAMSRRHFIVAGSAMAILPAVSGARSLGYRFSGGHVRGDIDGLISMLVPTDVSFNQTLDSLFPNLRTNDDFALIAPASVLVTNVGELPLKALSFRWLINTPAGMKNHLDGILIPSNNKTLLTANQNVLKQNQTRLITPFFYWRSDLFRKQKTINWDVLLYGDASRMELTQLIQLASSISIEIDATVNSDWICNGKDEFGLAKQITIRRNAEQDESMSALQLFDQAMTRTDVVRALRQHKSPEGIGGTSGLLASGETMTYYESRVRQAKVLRRFVRSHNRPTIVSKLAQITRQPKTQISVTAA